MGSFGHDAMMLIVIVLLIMVGGAIITVGALTGVPALSQKSTTDLFNATGGAPTNLTHPIISVTSLYKQTGDSKINTTSVFCESQTFNLPNPALANAPLANLTLNHNSGYGYLQEYINGHLLGNLSNSTNQTIFNVSNSFLLVGINQVHCQ